MKRNLRGPFTGMAAYTILFITTWYFSRPPHLPEMEVEMHFSDELSGLSTWKASLPDTVIDGVQFNFTQRSVFIEAAGKDNDVPARYLVPSNRFLFKGKFYASKTLPNHRNEILPLHRSYVFRYDSYTILKPYRYIEFIPAKIDWDPNMSTRLIPPPDRRYITVK
jgi:hypothetical protein